MKPIRNISIEEQGTGRWTVLLNSMPILTPKGQPLLLPSRPLAEAISAEWQRQAPQKIDPATMPFQQMAATATDIIAIDPVFYRQELLKYGVTDLLCYRADQDLTLAAKQMEHWQPLLNWLREKFDVHLRATSAILAIDQPDLPRLMPILEALNIWQMAALGVAVPNLGSLVLGLALLHGRIDIETAHHLAHLEQLHQEERWGEDSEALARRHNLIEELRAVRAFLDLVEE